MRGARRRLVINADDFGFTEGVNRGIIEAHDAGVVTSTSMMVNMPGWEDGLARLPARKGSLGVGLHLNLIVGAPLTRCPSLTDGRTGQFHPFRSLALRAAAGRVALREVHDECAAQLDRLVRAGVRVTHVDAHRHTHCFRGFFAPVREAAQRIGVSVVRVPRERLVAGVGDWRGRAKALVLRAGMTLGGAPARDAQPAFFGMTLLGARDFLPGLLALLDALPEGTSELMVHPGYATAELASLDTYRQEREREVRALTSPELRARLARGDIELVHFGMG